MRLEILFEAAYPSHPGGKVTNPNDGSQPGDPCQDCEGTLVLKRKSPAPFEKEAIHFLGCSNYPKCHQYMAAPREIERTPLQPAIGRERPEPTPTPSAASEIAPTEPPLKHSCEPEERQTGETYKAFFTRKKNCEACKRRTDRRLEAGLSDLPTEPEKPVEEPGSSLKLDPNKSKIMQILDILRGIPHGAIGTGIGSSGKTGIEREIRPDEKPEEVRRKLYKNKTDCKFPGCDKQVTTEFGRPKPYCTDHIDESPYIKDLKKKVDEFYAGEPESELKERNRAREAFEKAEEEYGDPEPEQPRSWSSWIKKKTEDD